MNRLFKLLIITLLISLLSACKEDRQPQQKEAKYVFFLIGDGMGLAHRAMTEMYLASLDNEIGQKRLLMNLFPAQGYAATYSMNSYITCSAASGTALATGKKTNNGMIACSPDTIPYLTIAEAAKKQGKSVGILTNVMLNHATPAAFSAHAPSRSNTDIIRNNQLISGFDYFAGGYMTIEKKITQADQNNLLEQAKENKYQVFSSKKELKRALDHEKVIFFADTLESGGAMLYAIDYPKNRITLKDLFETGIEKLSANPNGFFMMLESGKIDWAAHSNDPVTIIHEIIDFDNIIRSAFDFYENHPDETLIVVTADHETGGLALGNFQRGYTLKPYLLSYQKGSIERIKEAYQVFKTDYSNKDKNSNAPFEFVDMWFGFGNAEFALNKQDSIAIQEAWKKDIAADKESASELVKRAKNILAQKSGLGWTTGAHTGIPVPVSAIGVGSELFDGYYDNTDIPKKMAELMHVEL
ncbi:MAG: alkaline phosphatase [Bacteroidales bacterium]|jgi:alkaline phosphatase|nr:alkaline phosphatase [Bacteroidales bacterium]